MSTARLRANLEGWGTKQARGLLYCEAVVLPGRARCLARAQNGLRRLADAAIFLSMGHRQHAWSGRSYLCQRTF